MQQMIYLSLYRVLHRHLSADLIREAVLDVQQTLQSVARGTENLRWLIENSVHGDISGEVPEHLAKMLEADRELRAIEGQTDLELLRACLTRLGVKFTEATEIDTIKWGETREYYKDDAGNTRVRFTGGYSANYDVRVDTDVASGHADIALFFDHGKCVHSVGYGL